MSRTKSDLSLSGIAAVERDTGLSKEVLRVWERRYGFPSPARDAQGDRVYAAGQVEKLKLIRRLMDLGRRPGRLVAMTPEALRAEVEGLASSDRQAAAIDALLELVRGQPIGALFDTLEARLLALGLRRFVLEAAAPLSIAVGAAWAAGELEVFEEHLFSEQLSRLLRRAIIAAATPSGRTEPRVLLTTVPQEPHGLGLLMAEAMLTLEGCDCVSLGPQTPTADIAAAALACEAQVVALSFSLLMTRVQAEAALDDLRARLGPEVEIWIGGALAGLVRPPPGVAATASLEGVAQRVADWRSARGR